MPRKKADAPVAEARQIAAGAFLDRARSDRDFYFRNAIKIRPKSGGSVVPFAMRAPQERLMALVDSIRAKGRRPLIVILKARQIGFSTVTDAELFRSCHLFPHQQALITAHKAESAEYLFASIQLMYEQLPEAIRSKKKYSTKRLIHFEENNSRLQVEVAGESRGFAAQILHISEMAFMDDAAKLMTAIMQTVGDNPECLVIVESTPNGIGNTFHELYMRARSGKSEWVPFFVPWFEEPSYARAAWFTLDELNARTDDAGTRAAELVRLHGVSLDQVAWWLNTLENKCLGDLDVMEQEYASDEVSCFAASGSHVFDREGLAHYMALAGIDTTRSESPEERAIRITADPLWHSIETNPDNPTHPRVFPERGGPLWIIRPPEPRHRYIWAADLSGGDPGSDPTVAVCLNQHTLNVDAIIDGRFPPETMYRLVEGACYHYNRAKMVGEANNHGILFHHEAVRCRYPNLYFRTTSESSVAGKVTDKPGFWTHGENREHLFNLVRRFVREKIGRVEYERMVMEWAELRRSEEGSKRVDHPKGGTSDLTIAFGIALAVHAGAYDATLSPLTLEQRDAAAAVYDQIRMHRGVGADTSLLESALDLTGMTIEDADRAHELLERRARRRTQIGLSGAS